MKNLRSRKSSISGIASPFNLGGRFGTVIFLILSIFLFAFSTTNNQYFSGARTTVMDGVSPVINAVGLPFQNLSKSVSSLSGLSTLRAENTKLKAENVRLREWYQTALMLQAENQAYHRLLNVKIDAQQNFITSRVISDNSNSFVKSAILASGKDQAVEKNQAVLSGEGMIGRIIEVGEKTSRILLLTDINSKLPILIEGTSQKAIMAGDNSLLPVVKHLPKDTSLTVGSRVVTSGDGGIFPPGLPVGRLVKKSGAFSVQLYGNLDKILFVRILNTSKPSLMEINN